MKVIQNHYEQLPAKNVTAIQPTETIKSQQTWMGIALINLNSKHYLLFLCITIVLSDTILLLGYFKFLTLLNKQVISNIFEPFKFENMNLNTCNL